jgi:hypothetical protein
LFIEEDWDNLKENNPRSTHEGALRYMALEDKISRRDLVLKMKQAFDVYQSHIPTASLLYVCKESEQAYSFLQLKPSASESYIINIHKRKELLKFYTFFLKEKFVCKLSESIH